MGTPALSPRENFIRTVARPDGQVNLTAACLYVAAEEYHDLDVVAYTGRISLLAERAKARLAGKHSVYDAIHAINDLLFDEEGFQGNNDNYYDPRNSYLNDVLDRRLGIPITLSVLYMEIARRLGHRLRGIGMPGHFMLAAGHGASEIFIDPYHRGGLLSRRECVALAMRGRKTPGEQRPVTLARKLLPASDARAILRRLLTNMKLIFARQRDYERALKASERIQLLDPANWRNLTDLARLQAEVGQFMQAVNSLTEFLERAPAGTDTRQAEDALRQLRAITARPGSAELG
ncbi:MAG: transglutaminase-like domain-containing protein [Dehalococcoidia bacterium]